MFNNNWQGLTIKAGSIAAFLLLWFLLSWWIGDHQILPGPVGVAAKIGSEFANGELTRNLGATLMRVIASFVVAMAIGSALGFFMGRNDTANKWLDVWLIVLLNIPALVTIVLCYLWIGLNEAAAITAVAANKIPLVATMVREGARAFDPKLDAMAQSFQFSPMAKLRHILLPQLAPHTAAAARAGLSLTWKIVLVVEFLGRPNGVGLQIHTGFQLFDVTLVLAYAFAFIIVMMAVEFLVLQPVERRANRWRDA